jgi:hypothetical protein
VGTQLGWLHAPALLVAAGAPRGGRKHNTGMLMLHMAQPAHHYEDKAHGHHAQ